ncbi:prolyl oligopeptidase family serine peptidase [Alphaproteobacteria bacterium]|nr:prolyl oligopeptidase family serine peptidase [Alphaproteobacteria bacterium]
MISLATTPVALAGVAATVLVGIHTLPTAANADVFDAMFAPPTAAEKRSVIADWDSRKQSVQGWRVEESRRDDGYRLHVVSHIVDGNRHFAAVRTPEDHRPGQSAPILVLNHGGWNGTDAVWATEVADDCLADFFVLVPSYRGEELRTGERTYRSTGQQSLIDRDVDDTMALISGVLRNFPGAQGDDISTWGYSRGGGVSLMLGIRDPRVDRVVNVFGPTDVVTHDDMADRVRETHRGEDNGPFFGFPAQYVDAHMRGKRSKASVRRQLIGGSALHFADRLPARVQTHHGARDTIVPVGNARALHDALDQRRDMAVNEYFEYRFGGHGELRGMDRRAVRMLCEDR